jgi:release factor H-coupled RctB family protein
VFPIRLKRPVPEKLAARFPDLDRPLGTGEIADLGFAGPVPADYRDSLGTVGRGNHFVELARVDPARVDPARVERRSPELGDLVLIVHSGSRGLGERILRAHTAEYGAGPAADPIAYREAHDEAVRWGSLNRRLMAARIADALGAEFHE